MKKTFSWIGFLFLMIFLLGIAFGGFVIYSMVNFPYHPLVLQWFGTGESAIQARWDISGLLAIWLIIGGICIPQIWKITAHNRAAEIAASTAPILTVQASVVSKATQVVGDHFNTGTAYYISFELLSGIRKNFTVDINQYNSIRDDDVGILSYQETDNFLFFIDFQH